MRVQIRTLGDVADFECGLVGKTFERDLEALLGDCGDRATCDKVRSLAVKLELTPVADSAGALAEVRMCISISTKRPADKTRTVSAKAVDGGFLAYDDLTPDDVNQGTFPLGKVGGE